MPTELIPAQSQEVAVIVTEEQKELVKRTVAPDATEQELQLYFYDCSRRGIHPLDRLLHFTKRQGKYTPLPTPIRGCSPPPPVASGSAGVARSPRPWSPSAAR